MALIFKILGIWIELDLIFVLFVFAANHAPEPLAAEKSDRSAGPFPGGTVAKVRSVRSGGN